MNGWTSWRTTQPLPPKTMFAVGTSVALEELPATDKEATGVSASPMVNAMGAVAVPCAVVWFPMAEMVGAVLVAVAGFTVMTRVAFPVAAPSLAVKVTVLATGLVPALVKVWLVAAPAALPPSPKFQEYVAPVPVLVLVNVTFVPAVIGHKGAYV